MLIDNRNDRYPQSGLGIKTVWDFINMYSGRMPSASFLLKW